jgi:hypothetical protein
MGIGVGVGGLGGTLNGCISKYGSHLYEPSGAFMFSKRGHITGAMTAIRMRAVELADSPAVDYLAVSLSATAASSASSWMRSFAPSVIR